MPLGGFRYQQGLDPQPRTQRLFHQVRTFQPQRGSALRVAF